MKLLLPTLAATAGIVFFAACDSNPNAARDAATGTQTAPAGDTINTTDPIGADLADPAPMIGTGMEGTRLSPSPSPITD